MGNVRRFTVAVVVGLGLGGCDPGEEEGRPVDEGSELELDAEEDAEGGKTGEASFDPTRFCLENEDGPRGPHVGPAALGANVLGTSGRADGFGNESWGAEYGATLSLKGVEGGPRGTETRVRGELVGRATAYDVTADVVRIALDGHSAADGNAAFDANLTILDRFVYPLFSYEGDFSDEKSFSAPLLTATTGVPLVPGLAPVEVEVAVTGQLGYLVSGQLLPRGIAILVRPQATILATATASASAIGIAQARVEGHLELLELSVPIQVALLYDEEDGLQFRWDVRVDLSADWLAGTIDLVASAFGQERYRKSLAQWEGYHLATTHLSDGAGEIFPGHPGNCDPSRLIRDDAAGDPLTLALAGSSDAAANDLDRFESNDGGRDEAVRAALDASHTARWVQADPSAAGVVALAAREATGHGDRMLSALAQAGGPDAEAALRALGVDSSLDADVRARATAALGRVAVPEPETIEHLRTTFDRAEGELATVAGYALGTALGARRPFDPEGTDTTIAALERRYVETATLADRIVLLQVLGNVGADRTLPLLQAELADPEPQIRAAAAHALRHVPGRDAETLLAEVMTRDEDAYVREAAIRAADARGTRASVAAIASRAPEEPDGWVQIAALHALGRAVTRSDEAARALRRLESEAPLAAVRVTARNYLHRLDVEIAP
jgi:HEAT repeat protein